MTDFLLLLSLLGLAAMGGIAGYQVCQLRHKQHGIDTDPWRYIAPQTPPDPVPGLMADLDREWAELNG